MNYLKNSKTIFSKLKNFVISEKSIPCKKCGELISKKDLKENLYICPNCGQYLTMPVIQRFNLIFDTYEIVNIKTDIKNPINFPDYEKKLKDNIKKTGFNEAVIVAKGKIGSYPCYCFILNPNFLMGSLSSNAGYIISQCFKMAKISKYPVISFVSSGGARMQEGIFSLMQMANTTFALRDFSKDNNLYISIMTNPTMGGVPASFASLGDINLAEPNAKIGFTGPRVIEQTLKIKLPKEFQSSEFLLNHGFLDDIVPRANMKKYLEKILEYHERR